jgi:hypothetical protein
MLDGDWSSDVCSSDLCAGNTPIKLDCGHPGHKEKLRKDGDRFFRECGECQSSSLYYTNPPGAG